MRYATTVARNRVSALATPAVTHIGVTEALGRLRRGEPVTFVDARREEVWRRAKDRLPGALRLAPDRADETLPMIPAGYTTIVYCTCPAATSSLAAAELLATRGYEDVHVLQGGLSAWLLAGGPTQPV
jgi:rhodanese-related sulfurtransferase